MVDGLFDPMMEPPVDWLLPFLKLSVFLQHLRSLGKIGLTSPKFLADIFLELKVNIPGTFGQKHNYWK